MNDVGNFYLMERIGFGINYDMLYGVVLLVDKGYGDVVFLLILF